MLSVRSITTSAIAAITVYGHEHSLSIHTTAIFKLDLHYTPDKSHVCISNRCNDNEILLTRHN